MNKKPSIQSNYKFRRFKEEDLDRVVLINRTCLPENYAPSFFLEIHKANPETFIVVEHQNEVIGYVMTRIELGLSNQHKFRFGKKGHIVSLAVMPEHRQRGLGTSLMLIALKAMVLFHKCQETYLEVRVSNQSAIELYKKVGYKVTRRIPGYYIDGEEASFMSRELPLKPEEEILLNEALKNFVEN